MHPKKTKNTETQNAPYNYVAERDILTLILASSHIRESIMNDIDVEYFHNTNHQIVYLACYQAWVNDSMNFTASVINNIVESNIGDVSKAAFVLGLQANNVWESQLKETKDILHENKQKRELLRIGLESNEMINSGKPAAQISNFILNSVEGAAKNIASIDKNSQNFDEMLAEQLKSYFLENTNHLESKYNFLKAKAILGKGKLTILAARPAMGKTAFALNIGVDLAKQGKNIMFFSLEMNNQGLMERVLADECDIYYSNFKDKSIMKEKYNYILKATSEIAKIKFCINDTGSLSIAQLKQAVYKKHRTEPLDLIIVDYLQLMSGEINRNGNREQEIASIARGLKLLAKDLDIPIIALSQLSRAVETRGGTKKPQLSDLRESGSIEQDADNVIFLYRPIYYGIKETDEGYSTENLAVAITAKCRDGEVGEDELACDLGKMRFDNIGTKFVVEHPIEKFEM